MSAASTIEEAQSLAHRIVEHERGKAGGHVDTAIIRAVAIWGLEESHLRTLWKRRAITSVKAHVLDRLRQVETVINTAAEREADSLEQTACLLELHRHPAAGVARMAAQAARRKVEG